MSHVHEGPLATYNSLTDKNLSGYFSNSRMRRHLKKSGLVNRRGEIVSENQYRLNMARKEHKKHVKDLLAQAIVHKTLDLERNRQVEIKSKLEEIAKIELVRRVRAERTRSYDSSILPYLSPRTPKSPKPKSKTPTPRSVHEEEEEEQASTNRRGDEEILPYLSPRSSRPQSGQGKYRPKSAPSTDQKKRTHNGEVVYVDEDGRPLTPDGHHTRKSHAKTEHIDTRHLYALDTAALKKYALNLSRIEQGDGSASPYLNSQIPTPPRSARSSRSGGLRRSRRAADGRSPSPYAEKKPGTVQGTLMLHRQEPAMMHQGEVQTLCEIRMKYHGPNLTLPRDQRDPCQEVAIDQQHCGGNTLGVFKERLKPGEKFSFISRRHRGYPFSLTVYVEGRVSCRVSTCCEYGHATGVRLGGKMGHFSLLSVAGATPCYKCKLNAQCTPRSLKRPPEKKEQKGQKAEELREEVIVTGSAEKKQKDEDEKVEYLEPSEEDIQTKPTEYVEQEEEGDQNVVVQVEEETITESKHQARPQSDAKNISDNDNDNKEESVDNKKDNSDENYDDDFEEEEKEGKKDDSSRSSTSDEDRETPRGDQKQRSKLNMDDGVKGEDVNAENPLRTSTPIVDNEDLEKGNENNEKDGNDKHVRFDSKVQKLGTPESSSANKEKCVDEQIEENIEKEEADIEEKIHEEKIESVTNKAIEGVYIADTGLDTCDEVSDIEREPDTSRRVREKYVVRKMIRSRSIDVMKIEVEETLSSKDTEVKRESEKEKSEKIEEEEEEIADDKYDDDFEEFDNEEKSFNSSLNSDRNNELEGNVVMVESKMDDETTKKENGESGKLSACSNSIHLHSSLHGNSHLDHHGNEYQVTENNDALHDGNGSGVTGTGSFEAQHDGNESDVSGSNRALLDGNGSSGTGSTEILYDGNDSDFMESYSTLHDDAELPLEEREDSIEMETSKNNFDIDQKDDSDDETLTEDYTEMEIRKKGPLPVSSEEMTITGPLPALLAKIRRKRKTMKVGPRAQDELKKIFKRTIFESDSDTSTMISEIQPGISDASKFGITEEVCVKHYSDHEIQNIDNKVNDRGLNSEASVRQNIHPIVDEVHIAEDEIVDNIEKEENVDMVDVNNEKMEIDGIRKEETENFKKTEQPKRHWYDQVRQVVEVEKDDGTVIYDILDNDGELINIGETDDDKLEKTRKLSDENSENVETLDAENDVAEQCDVDMETKDKVEDNEVVESTLEAENPEKIEFGTQVQIVITEEKSTSVHDVGESEEFKELAKSDLSFEYEQWLQEQEAGLADDNNIDKNELVVDGNTIDELVVGEKMAENELQDGNDKIELIRHLITLIIADAEDEVYKEMFRVPSPFDYQRKYFLKSGEGLKVDESKPTEKSENIERVMLARQAEKRPKLQFIKEMLEKEEMELIRHLISLIIADAEDEVYKEMFRVPSPFDYQRRYFLESDKSNTPLDDLEQNTHFRVISPFGDQYGNEVDGGLRRESIVSPFQYAKQSRFNDENFDLRRKSTGRLVSPFEYQTQTVNGKIIGDLELNVVEKDKENDRCPSPFLYQKNFTDDGKLAIPRRQPGKRSKVPKKSEKKKEERKHSSKDNKKNNVADKNSHNAKTKMELEPLKFNYRQPFKDRNSVLSDLQKDVETCKNENSKRNAESPNNEKDLMENNGPGDKVDFDVTIEKEDKNVPTSFVFPNYKNAVEDASNDGRISVYMEPINPVTAKFVILENSGDDFKDQIGKLKGQAENDAMDENERMKGHSIDVKNENEDGELLQNNTIDGHEDSVAPMPLTAGQGQFNGVNNNERISFYSDSLHPVSAKFVILENLDGDAIGHGEKFIGQGKTDAIPKTEEVKDNNENVEDRSINDAKFQTENVKGQNENDAVPEHDTTECQSKENTLPKTEKIDDDKGPTISLNDRVRGQSKDEMGNELEEFLATSTPRVSIDVPQILNENGFEKPDVILHRMVDTGKEETTNGNRDVDTEMEYEDEFNGGKRDSKIDLKITENEEQNDDGVVDVAKGDSQDTNHKSAECEIDVDQWTKKEDDMVDKENDLDLDAQWKQNIDHEVVEESVLDGLQQFTDDEKMKSKFENDGFDVTSVISELLSELLGTVELKLNADEVKREFHEEKKKSWSESQTCEDKLVDSETNISDIELSKLVTQLIRDVIEQSLKDVEKEMSSALGNSETNMKESSTHEPTKLEDITTEDQYIAGNNSEEKDDFVINVEENNVVPELVNLETLKDKALTPRSDPDGESVVNGVIEGSDVITQGTAQTLLIQSANQQPAQSVNQHSVQLSNYGTLKKTEITDLEDVDESIEEIPLSLPNEGGSKLPPSRRHTVGDFVVDAPHTHASTDIATVQELDESASDRDSVEDGSEQVSQNATKVPHIDDETEFNCSNEMQQEAQVEKLKPTVQMEHSLHEESQDHSILDALEQVSQVATSVAHVDIENEICHPQDVDNVMQEQKSQTISEKHSVEEALKQTSQLVSSVAHIDVENQMKQSNEIQPETSTKNETESKLLPGKDSSHDFEGHSVEDAFLQTIQLVASLAHTDVENEVKHSHEMSSEMSTNENEQLMSKVTRHMGNGSHLIEDAIEQSSQVAAGIAHVDVGNEIVHANEKHSEILPNTLTSYKLNTNTQVEHDQTAVHNDHSLEDALRQTSQIAASVAHVDVDNEIGHQNEEHEQVIKNIETDAQVKQPLTEMEGHHSIEDAIRQTSQVAANVTHVDVANEISNECATQEKSPEEFTPSSRVKHEPSEIHEHHHVEDALRQTSQVAASVAHVDAESEISQAHEENHEKALENIDTDAHQTLPEVHEHHSVEDDVKKTSQVENEIRKTQDTPAHVVTYVENVIKDAYNEVLPVLSKNSSLPAVEQKYDTNTNSDTDSVDLEIMEIMEQKQVKSITNKKQDSEQQFQNSPLEKPVVPHVQSSTEDVVQQTLFVHQSQPSFQTYTEKKVSDNSSEQVVHEQTVPPQENVAFIPEQSVSYISEPVAKKDLVRTDSTTVGEQTPSLSRTDSLTVDEHPVQSNLTRTDDDNIDEQPSEPLVDLDAQWKLHKELDLTARPVLKNEGATETTEKQNNLKLLYNKRSGEESIAKMDPLVVRKQISEKVNGTDSGNH